MTPQERQLVAELFDRLVLLEGERRDAEAERAIADGLRRAPNAVYALVQTVLVQDEALKRADARIQELEARFEPQRESGFLDNMRGALFGRDERRGSVPSVRPGGQGTSGVWGARPEAGQPMGAPMGGASMGPPPGSGGSFLGTAAASAAGVIGGAMLLQGIRSMFPQAHAAGAFDPGSGGGARAPWGSGAAGSDLAREAGLNDIGGGRTASTESGARRAGLFDSDSDSDDAHARETEFDDETDFGDDFDGGDSDTA